MEGTGEIDWFAPIVADAESGFGGVLNAFELMKAMIDAGAAGVHFEDQLASVKKCGHMGGQGARATQEAVQKLIAARLAATCEWACPRAARQDRRRKPPDIVTTDVDEERQALSSPASAPSEGFYKTKKGFDQALSRGLAYAEYADMVWCETGTPIWPSRGSSPRASARSSRARCWPTTLAIIQLEEKPGRRYDRQVPARARRDGLQVPVHHAGRLPFAQLLDVRAGARLRARQHERFRRAAGKRVRRREKGFTAVKHQREVGTGYFDQITQVVTAGKARRPRCAAPPRTSILRRAKKAKVAAA